MATEEQVRELAYSIWEQDGRPDGKDWEHYYTARRILEQREAKAVETGAKQTIKMWAPQPAAAAARRSGRK